MSKILDILAVEAFNCNTDGNMNRKNGRKGFNTVLPQQG